MESTRMYPVIPWQIRAVVNRFVIEGYEIPPRTRLLMAILQLITMTLFSKTLINSI